MKVLVCFMSHVINDKLIERYFQIKESINNKYDVKYIIPTGNEYDKRIKDDIIYLNLNKDDLMDYITEKHIKNNVLYLKIYNKLINYDYYWFIENDVTINNENLVEGWKNLFEFYDENKSDLICSKINKWSDNLAYQMAYELSYFYAFSNKSLFIYNYRKIWFGFLTICRISNKLMNIIDNFYKYNYGYFEFIIPSLAKLYDLEISSFTEDNFDIEEFYGKIANTGSNGWNDKKNLTYINKYPKNVILHPSKLY